MFKKFPIWCLLGAFIILSACDSGQPASVEPVDNSSGSEVLTEDNTSAQVESAVVEIEPVDPPEVGEVAAGTATVTGSIYSTTFNQPIEGIPVSLSEIIRDENGEGVFVYDPAFSPTTDSLPGGYFVIEGVEPGEYMVVVGNIEINTYTIINNDDGSPRTFEAPADTVTDVAEIQVEGLDVYVVGPQSDGYPAPEVEGYPEPESDS